MGHGLISNMKILNIKHRRSLIGGLAAYKPQAYWLAFLRMYLGVMWLIEGIGKIRDGWLTDTTGSKVYWGPPAGGGDAVSAASAAWEGGGEAVAETVVETVRWCISSFSIIRCCCGRNSN